MNKNIKYKIAYFVLGLLFLNLISYLIFSNLNLERLFFLLIVLLGAFLTIYKLEYGLLMLFLELLIGSKGYLFYYPIGTSMVSMRIVLFAVVILIFLIIFIRQLIRKGKGSEYYQRIVNFTQIKYFAWLALFVVMGFVNGILRGHTFSNVFFDINSFVYLLLVFPAIVVYTGSGDNDKLKPVFNNLKIIFLAGTIYLSIETLILLFIFTHNLNIAPDVYAWLRKTLIGEMTPTLGGWPRIFIQSQIYPIIAFLFISFKEGFKKENIILCALFLSTMLISFSRSFWFALALTLVFSAVLVWVNGNFKKFYQLILKFFLAGALSFVLIYLVAVFPYPKTGAFNADFLNRLSNGGESAISSRWSLLPVLFKEIIKEPILGQGFGATATYKSSDPRVLANNPSGLYTTYAFEWGYLDLWLKVGLLGLFGYFLLLFAIIKKSLKKDNFNYLNLSIGMGLLFIALTHIFTPYLNHPLGFGYLIIASCLIPITRVY